VYILEAHSADVWQMPSNVKQGVIYSLPRTYEERTAVADSCVTKLSIRIPALIDTFENTTEKAYTGWPDRIYVIDRDGRVAFKTTPGPFGFKPAGMEQALRKIM
jgi:type I thyroxine 5'-deiodinase